ncbi:hypothetical protein BGZ58_006532, partial [Dissophora ornata]
MPFENICSTNNGREIEDESWKALCEVTRDKVDPISKLIVGEALEWSHLLADLNQVAFRDRLTTCESRPTVNLGAINRQTKTLILSHVTETQQDTRDEDLNRLVPDFSTRTL